MKNGNWYKVKVNGVTGYVSKDFSKIQEDETNIVEENTNSVENNSEQVNVQNTNQETQITTEETETEINEEQVMEMKTKHDTNVYILPLINANTIQSINAGSNVKVICKISGWAYVETDEVMGWIRQSVLGDSTVVPEDIDVTTNVEQEKKDDTVEDTEITSKIMYVNSPSVYVRKGPDTTYEVIDSLILNDTVKVIAENGDWYKVEVDGKTGYMAKRLLSSSETSTTTRSADERETVQETNETTNVTTNINETESIGNQIVEYAKQYLGCKYVYGASGPSTFDCSGFTMYVLKNFGVTLTHSATAQSKVGTYVAKQDLQPGDLVFFTDYETGNGIGHCGIYVGDGNFIHASSGTGYCVKISTLTTGSYLNRYETARRIF